jgi:NodT family efflux transporter outer membrane factor (OMF) lipoprotein
MMPATSAAWVRRAAAVMATVVTAGCASVGPKYIAPVVPAPVAYKEQAQGAEVLQPAQPSDGVRRSDWWNAFGDARLDALESQLMTSNPTLAQAEARFAEARALARQNRAEYFPTAGVSASVDRGRASAGQGGSVGTSAGTFTQYSLGGSVSWEPDLWGRIRNTVTAGVASAQAAAGDRESARLSLSAELAADYFQLRAFDAELVLLNQTTEAYQRSLALTQNQYNAGIVSRSDVAQAETQLESARAQAIDVQLQRAQVEHAIAALVGQPPAALTLDPMPLAGEPPQVPTDVPSRLLERRPDVAAGERRVAAANAQIGVAASAFFPAVTLGGSGGFQTTRLRQLLSWPSGFWSVGPALALTVFDGGARRAAKAQAVAVYDETIGAYRQTVLAAFADVEDNLAAERLLAQEAARLHAAVAAAQRALDISMNQYRAGLVNYLQVAVAQTTLLTNQRGEVSVTARRFAAAVQLIRALGGGWDGRLDADAELPHQAGEVVGVPSFRNLVALETHQRQP